MSSELLSEHAIFPCARLTPDRAGVATVADRQQRIPGYDQEAVGETTLFFVGGGGINGVIGLGAVKQGYTIHVTDPDVVEPSNLNRQFFGQEDLYKPKGPALARRLAAEGFLGSTVHGYPLFFSEFVHDNKGFVPDIGVIGVDNDRARAQATRWFLKKRRPAIFVAVGADGDGAYVFVQQPDAACLGCYRGASLSGRARHLCPGQPAVNDVLLAAAGFALYAVSSIVTKRPRRWNLTRISLASGTASHATVPRRPDCRFCARVTTAASLSA